MKEFFAAFIAQVRAAIAKLPTAESIEANGEVGWSLRNLAEAGVRLEVQFPALKGTTDSSAVEAEAGKIFDKFVADLKTEASTAALANAETAGTHVSKAAHELAVQTASANAEAAAKTKFDKAAADNAEAEGRRVKLAATGLRAEVAGKIPTATLVGDNAEALVTKITARIEQLKTIGLATADNAEAFDLCALPGDDAGDATFASAFGVAEKAANAAKATAAANAESTPTKPKGNPAEVVPPAAEKKAYRLR